MFAIVILVQRTSSSAKNMMAMIVAMEIAAHIYLIYTNAPHELVCNMSLIEEVAAFVDKIDNCNMYLKTWLFEFDI
jgi:hypothetical protein